MKRIDKLKSAEDWEKWICGNVLMDDCDACPLGDKCSPYNHPILEMLNEDITRYDKECITCDKFADYDKCQGKLMTVSEEGCIHWVERKL